MPALRDILDRFRPAPGPGRPSPVGVPSPSRSTAAEELQAVFAALDDVLMRCDAMREEARRQAAGIREATDLQLASVKSQAVTTADQTRAAARASVQSAGRARHAAELASAQEEAMRIRADGIARMSPYIAAAVSRVRGLPSSHLPPANAGDAS